jgi:hypothetical protein
MRIPILIAALCIAGCAGQPPTKTAAAESAKPAADAAGAAAKPQKKKVIPERVQGPYKVVMRGDKKLYCTKEVATGSHVNYRTICLTPEEYADLEASSREWKDEMQSIIPPDVLPDPRRPLQ